ncbi:MAG: 3-oxoacyl-ACP synthase III [Proteobacteria bacterium]|nr:3-oxoacyl-ACP synthase III [Pseudomonadota bacterium]
MQFNNVYMHPFGYELPPRVITSTQLEEELKDVYSRLKLPEGRLELMTGIKERRFWDEGTTPSRGAALAGKKALDASGVSPEDIECLIFTAVSRDMMEPATAAFVHNELGLAPNCQVFDLSNACLGFLNGMIIMAGMLELGHIKNGLIVSSETAEDLVGSTLKRLKADTTITRKSIKSSFASLTIGSGAVAMVMGNRQTGGPHRLVGGTYRANTAQNHLCRGGQTSAAGTLMSTDSEELLKQGVETAHATWNKFTGDLNWSQESIARFFCHQVGTAHARLLFETLGLDIAKNFETLEFLGNVGSVSAPITMAIGVEKGMLKKDERAALLGIGSGINCLMLGVHW